MVQASTTGEAVIETYLALSGVVCSALPHTVSQDLHANHEGKQPRSRQGDSWWWLGWRPAGLPACSVCTVSSRLAASRLVLLLPLVPLRPHLRHAPALQWLTFFFSASRDSRRSLGGC